MSCIVYHWKLAVVHITKQETNLRILKIINMFAHLEEQYCLDSGLLNGQQ